jgi:pimeloyl-ACP methyl ester carboxylesterase
LGGSIDGNDRERHSPAEWFGVQLPGWGPAAGKPVILLHGFPQFADVWTPLLDKLGALGFRAVALEQRGYSPNARPVEVEEYALAKLNADVLALVDHLAWPQFHLIGHDWGGFLAWALAAKHPGRVQSLTVLSTPHVNAFLEAVACDPDQKARSQYIQWFKMPGNVAEAVFLKDDGSRLRGVYQGKVPDEQVSRNLQRLLEPGALTATLNWYRALDLDTRIGHVCVPYAIRTGRRGHGFGTCSGRSNRTIRKRPLSL